MSKILLWFLFAINIVCVFWSLGFIGPPVTFLNLIVAAINTAAAVYVILAIIKL